MTLREVGSKSKEVQFNEKDPWVLEALKNAAPHSDICGRNPEEWALASTVTGNLLIERLDPEYSVSGNFSIRVPLLCPRCGADGSVAREGEFRVFLRPQGPKEVVEEGDDPDYKFLETPYIDLPGLLTEQMVAAEPVVEHPDLEASGKPHTCQELVNVLQESDVDHEFHLSSGQNDGKARNSPFAILGKLKEAQEPALAPKNLKKKSKE